MVEPIGPTLCVILGPFVASEVWARKRKAAVKMSNREMMPRCRLAIVIIIQASTHFNGVPRFWLSIERIVVQMVSFEGGREAGGGRVSSNVAPKLLKRANSGSGFLFFRTRHCDVEIPLQCVYSYVDPQYRV